MAELDVLVRAPRAITPGGEMPCSIGVSGGTIVTVASLGADLSAREVVVLGDDVVVLPGLVDTHVHVNEPGRTEWEGFATATRAAAAGGVTTIIDMPLNSVPPTTDVPALDLKRRAAAGKAHVDVGFWGGAVPGNLARLPELHAAGVFGFKCFLVDSGVEEFPPLPPAELEAALRQVARLDALMVVHAEDPSAIDRATAAHGRTYRAFLESRPAGAENLAVAHLAELGGRTGCRVHVLHLSSAEALPLVASAQRDGVRLTAETCPHYLSFAAEDIPDGATLFKCCPPIREEANRELLWQGLRHGTVGSVVSDHSPCTGHLKRLDSGDFGAAWGGIASLQVGLPATWTEARRRDFTLPDVVRWMAEAPARLVGLRTKGRISVGAAADLCVFAPDDTFDVDAASLHHRNPVSAWDGSRLTGGVRETWLAGRRIEAHDEPRGRLLRRGTA